jgi:RNA polymerase sigma-70 factor (ECF subfamily)
VSREDRDIAGALQALDPQQRDALLLHVWGELSYAEVAASLEIPIGTVRSRISRACAVLRVELDRPLALAQAADDNPRRKHG